jgi:hypothetical protein
MLDIWKVDVSETAVANLHQARMTSLREVWDNRTHNTNAPVIHLP